jgi:hypothetical protein
VVAKYWLLLMVGQVFSELRLACIHNHPVPLDDLMTAESKVIAMVILG